MDETGSHSRMNARKWDARAERYDRALLGLMKFMQRRTLALAPLRPGLSFLDIGCGTGWAVRYVARLLHRQGQFHGIDVSPRMIDKAKEHTGEGDSTHFLVGDAEALPFADASFDLVICTNSFHHYRDPGQVLQEIRRALRPGGQVRITDPTADDVVGKLMDRRQRRREPEHVRFYTSEEYGRMFAGAGFQYLGGTAITILTMKVHAGRKADVR
jgi:ubiquinone/menaquinone biosynthesis C-methylase UbiE